MLIIQSASQSKVWRPGAGDAWHDEAALGLLLGSQKMISVIWNSVDNRGQALPAGTTAAERGNLQAGVLERLKHRFMFADRYFAAG